jgi:hypothetical protein
VFALATGATTAVVRTAASVAMILRVLRLIEPSLVPEPPGAARREGACAHPVDARPRKR